MIRSLGVFLAVVFGCHAADPSEGMVIGSTANQYVFVPSANIATEGFIRVFVVPTTLCAPNAVDVRFSVDRVVAAFGKGSWSELFQLTARVTDIVTQGSARALELNFAERGMTAGFYRIRIEPQLTVVEGKTSRCVGVNVPDSTSVSHIQTVYFFVEAAIDEWAAPEFRELTRVRSAALLESTPEYPYRTGKINTQAVILLAVDWPAQAGDEAYFVLYQLESTLPTNVYVTLRECHLGELVMANHKFDRTRPVFLLTVNERTGASYGAQLVDNPLSTPGAILFQ